MARGNYWPPWEESIAASGFAAVHTLFGGIESYALAQLVADNIVKHGVGIAPVGWRVGYKIPFDAQPGMPYFALTDPNFASNQAAGSGLTLWTLPAIVLTARYSQDPVAQQMALHMLAGLFVDPRVVEPRMLEWIPVIPRHVTR